MWGYSQLRFYISLLLVLSFSIQFKDRNEEQIESFLLSTYGWNIWITRKWLSEMWKPFYTILIKSITSVVTILQEMRKNTVHTLFICCFFSQVWDTTLYINALHVSAPSGHLQRRRRCYQASHNILYMFIVSILGCLQIKLQLDIIYV
jgi:hypothetical protein